MNTSQGKDKKFARRYPWEGWFQRALSGARVTLVKGIHFTCTSHGMYRNAIRAASVHLPDDKRLKATVRDHTFVLEVVDREQEG